MVPGSKPQTKKSVQRGNDITIRKVKNTKMWAITARTLDSIKRKPDDDDKIPGG